MPEKAPLRIYRTRRKYPVPDDATLILELHFKVHSFTRSCFHAEAVIEIPTIDGGVEILTVSAGSKTKFAALRRVIEQIQTARWFHTYKANRVYFHISGERMDEVYRGFL